MFTGLVGATIGGLADWAVSERANEHSAEEARKADERSHRYWAEQNYMGPTIQRKGLEDAGYNPMLALNRSTSAAPTTHMGQTSMPDISSSAKSMGKFLQEAIKDKVGAEIENVEADTELKDAQTKEAKIRSENTESSTRLLDSQKERNDLGYGRDIVSTISDLANVGISAHNAKTLGDLRKVSPKGSTSKPNSVKPSVKPPPKPSKILPKITQSAKTAGAALLGLPAAAGAGLGYLEGKNKEREIKSGEHWDSKDKDNRKEKSRKKWYLYHDIGF